MDIPHRLLGWLARRSLRLLHALGGVLAWAGYLLSASYRQRLRTNAALAGIGPAERRAAVADAGWLVMELPRLWLRPRHLPIADPVHWDVAEIVEDLLAQGRGLVFLTPHLGIFEVAAHAYAERFGARQPVTVLYRPYIADRVQTVATAFPGLTFECSRCHDHKYDPIKQKEYYGLFSMLQNIDEAGLYSFFTPSADSDTDADGSAREGQDGGLESGGG